MISQTQVWTLIPSMGLGEHLQNPHIFIGATLVSCRFILVTLWLELRLGLASVSSCLVEWRTHGPLVAAGGETAVSQSMCWFVALSCTCRWQWLHVCVWQLPGVPRGSQCTWRTPWCQWMFGPTTPKWTWGTWILARHLGVDGIYHRFTHLSWKMMIIDRVWGTQFWDHPWVHGGEGFKKKHPYQEKIFPDQEKNFPDQKKNRSKNNSN